MVSSNIASILRSVAEIADPPVHVSGATAPVRALITSRYAQARIRPKDAPAPPVVLLCPNDEIASEVCADLESLSDLLEDAPLKVILFPTWEQSAYSPITPSIRTRLARLTALSQLVQNQPPDIIVTSIAAASQATLPTELFQSASVPIAVDEVIESRDAWVARLLTCGYLRVDPVEDPGTLAVRGDIIDIFPSDRDRPVRIELFGDTVEKIRQFDPATQRALPETPPSALMKIVIPTAREVLIHPMTSTFLRERLKSFADDLGIPRASRDPILESVRNGNYPDHSDTWAPFAYAQPAVLWDYLPEGYSVVWIDELSCEQEWNQFLSEQKELAKDATQSGRVSPDVQELFRWNPALEKTVRKNSRLFLDRIELADPESQAQEAPEDTGRLHVATRDNKDLSRALPDLIPKFQLWLKQKFKVMIVASTQSQLERIRFLLEERNLFCHLKQGPVLPGVITLGIGTLSEGFRWPAEGVIFLTEEDVLGHRHTKKQRRASSIESGSAAQNWSGLQALSDLAVGDTVVHLDHGIGRYQGIVRLNLSGALSDFIQLEYANKDRLYLPVYRLNVIQKFLGAGQTVTLDKLGSQQFATTKDKVKESVKKLAIDLVQLYAERKIRPGIQFSPPDASFREFEAQFPFDETPDQLKAINAVLADMESGRVMDRLVCGDVGYGKTEVAIRAAFRAVSDGKQVAVLVPTTLLAQQHEQSFKNRFQEYPLIIESLSRFKTSKEQKAVVEGIEKGKIDIVVGTHRLLSKDVRFHDLGLLIVDEEHRFGVEHKERLKALKVDTHVLTLTATPIPRTLHMSLSGLRDISLINTPPIDRLPIRTYVSKFDETLIQRAIDFELSRGGQVFFLHNRVQTIHPLAKRVQELVPKAKVIVAHGQMAETELENTMLSFYKKQADVLVCTAIIESGLDLPSANTILIDRADSLGLAQLYQIRGRVGRGQARAYAYLLIPAEGGVTEDAKKRLEVIQRFVELGSGFSIASHDLELRGGGDLLGPQQSGNIAAVGFDLYMELLEEAIREIQGKPLLPEESQSRREPEIKVPFPAFLGDDYVPDVHQRLSLYRRFSAANRQDELDRLEEELRDRFGSPPVETQNLFWLIRIKLLLKKMRIESLTAGPEKVSLVPGPESLLDPVRAIALISAHPHQYLLTPDSKLVAKVPTGSLRDLYFGLETLFKEFGQNPERLLE